MGEALGHAAIDELGTGSCSVCSQPVTTYGRGTLEHRRGRRKGGVARPEQRGPKPPKPPRCNVCGRVRPLRRFALVSEVEGAGPNRVVFRRAAGSAKLCQLCWKRVVGVLA